MEDAKVTISLEVFTNLVIDHAFVEQIRRKLIAQKLESRDRFETVLVKEQEMPDAWSL